MSQVAWLIWCLIAYLCGSISFALILGRVRGIDIRKAGSGNVGATNVGRVLGKKWGMLCFLLDVLKGFLPVFIAGLALGYIGGRAGSSGDCVPMTLTQAEAWKWLAILVCTVIGHVFPIWLKFKGGKGVATGLGALLGIWPVLSVAGLAGLGVWILIVKTLRYVGVASVAAAGSLPVWVCVGGLARQQEMGDLVPFFIVTGFLALLVLVRHRANLARTFKGTEPKVGEEGGPRARGQGPGN
ncbi:MAG: glycerol-3-phosphate 1-O-acyltransferase PlsY [Phycisphaeraceae bacterium]